MRAACGDLAGDDRQNLIRLQWICTLSCLNRISTGPAIATICANLRQKIGTAEPTSREAGCLRTGEAVQLRFVGRQHVHESQQARRQRPLCPAAVQDRRRRLPRQLQPVPPPPSRLTTRGAASAATLHRSSLCCEVDQCQIEDETITECIVRYSSGIISENSNNNKNLHYQKNAVQHSCMAFVMQRTWTYVCAAITQLRGAKAASQAGIFADECVRVRACAGGRGGGGGSTDLCGADVDVLRDLPLHEEHAGSAQHLHLSRSPALLTLRAPPWNFLKLAAHIHRLQHLMAMLH